MAESMIKRAYIAMSGGVDSAVAALLMMKEGYECTGVTMVVGNGMNIDIPLDEGNLLQDSDDAKKVCDRLGIPHITVDLRQQFKNCVIDGFVNEYNAGRTPNPCVNCNRHIKFGELVDSIRKHDLKTGGTGQFIYATGHYAINVWDEKRNCRVLKESLDESKDQTYMLYNLSQEQLAYVRFPLGTFTKTEVRKIAGENGFEVAGKHDSQDICFVPDGEYAEIISEITGETTEPGNFIDVVTGKVLGRHKGQLHYTIGQRKGLGLSLPAPMYVCGKDVEKNIVYLSDNGTLFGKELKASEVNFCTAKKPADGEHFRCNAKIRYAHKPQPATAYLEGGMLNVVFDEPQRAITEGQSVVLYDNDEVIGGGVICH